MTAEPRCSMIDQGFAQGSCSVEHPGGVSPACQVTLRETGSGDLSRLITSIHLSRPENYLSIYQSGCNMSCKKCHSWYFSKKVDGQWYTPQDILEECLKYQQHITLSEPRERATAWHAHDTCRCCGSCFYGAQRPKRCPGVLKPEQVVLSPQGFGPARNIAAFTGGDIGCRPEFYCECANLIKGQTDLWVLFETNGYGLTHPTLDLLAESGVDAFWLDIKAFDNDVHRWLTGVDNERILSLPREIIGRDFVLEVLSLYIPGVVETDQLTEIARLLADVDPSIPLTILAFFPENKMKDYRAPHTTEMVEAYSHAKSAGLQNIRLGNIGVFAKTDSDHELLTETLGADL